MMVLPIVIIFFMAIGFSFLFDQGIYIDGFDIVVINQDQHPLSKFLIQQIKEDENLENLLNIWILEDEAEGERRVRENEVVAAVILPNGFIHSLETGTNHSVKLITNLRHPLKGHLIRGIMDSYMKSVSGGQSAVNAVWDYYTSGGMTYEERKDKIEWVINDITLAAYFARSNVFEKITIKGVNSLSPLQFYSISIPMIFLMFSCLSGGKDMAEEERTKIVYRIRLTGIGGISYMLGKSMAVFMINLIKTLPLFILGAYLLLGGFTKVYGYVFILYMVLLFCLSSLSLLGAVVLKSREKLDLIGNNLILIMALIGGGIIPYVYLPPSLQYFSRFTINYWGVQGVLGFLDNRPSKGITSIFLFIAVGVFVFIVCCYLHHREEGLGYK